MSDRQLGAMISARSICDEWNETRAFRLFPDQLYKLVLRYGSWSVHTGLTLAYKQVCAMQLHNERDVVVFVKGFCEGQLSPKSEFQIATEGGELYG